MNDNESVISFEIDTTKIDKSIEKLKEALPQSFNREVEHLKKGVDNLNKQTEALLQKQTKQHANVQKQLQQQLLKPEKNRELPQAQTSQYTQKLSSLQKQYKALQSDYNKTDNSDIAQLKEAIKKQQENLISQAYNIKQARLQNTSPLLSAEQKSANRISLNQQVELFNKQKQNTLKNAMNLDKASQNIKLNAKNITEQKNSFLNLGGLSRIHAGILTLAGMIAKLISIFNSYDNLKYNLMNTQKFANASQISFREARAFKEVARQTQDQQILQLVNTMGNLQNYPQFNNRALQLIGLSREGLLKMKTPDRVFKLLERYQSKFNTLSDLEKGILNDMFASDLGVSRDYLKELTGSFNKGGHSFIQHYRAIYDAAQKTLLNQKNTIARDKIFKGITKADIEGSKAEMQSQQADLFKLNQLSSLHAVTNSWLYNINTILTKIYATLDRLTIFPSSNHFTTFNLHDNPTISHANTSAYNSMIITNKANQGGTP